MYNKVRFSVRVQPRTVSREALGKTMKSRSNWRVKLFWIDKTNPTTCYVVGHLRTTHMYPVGFPELTSS